MTSCITSLFLIQAYLIFITTIVVFLSYIYWYFLIVIIACNTSITILLFIFIAHFKNHNMFPRQQSSAKARFFLKKFGIFVPFIYACLLLHTYKHYTDIYMSSNVLYVIHIMCA